ncbi:MAG: pyrroline-5-carboxylate reductase [Gammaproteobacteria bacterium]
MGHDTNILLVGCGNMGRALVKGWLTEGRGPKRIQVVDPDTEAASVARELGVKAVTNLSEVQLPVEVIVLAVKPQQLESVLPAYRDLVAAGTVVLSIAAGKPIEFYEHALGGEPAIVRGMPNTPAAICQGMTVLSASRAVTADQHALCQALMAAVGEVAWLEDEQLMDAVTAVSGSGPAYVFLFIECLTDAAVSAGLERNLARQLAEQTVAGAGAYALGSEQEADELRRRVTSPGGTTEAALEILMSQDAFPALLVQAVQAASKRARELA